MEMHTDYPDDAPPPNPWAGLRVRVISALVMGTAVLFATLAGGMWFTTLVLLAALQMLREWDALTADENDGWRGWGMAYVAVPCATLIALRGVELPQLENAGLGLVLQLMFTVWACDIGAYFAGRRIGGPKLAPTLSPGKTWAGLIGGMAASGAVCALCLTFSPFPASVGGAVAVGMLLAVVAQLGDLFESALKRRAGVKDSGHIIPGHGGVLDRVDGLAAAAPVYGLMVALSGLGV